MNWICLLAQHGWSTVISRSCGRCLLLGWQGGTHTNSAFPVECECARCIFQKRYLTPRHDIKFGDRGCVPAAAALEGQSCAAGSRTLLRHLQIALITSITRNVLHFFIIIEFFASALRRRLTAAAGGGGWGGVLHEQRWRTSGCSVEYLRSRFWWSFHKNLTKKMWPVTENGL